MQPTNPYQPRGSFSKPEMKVPPKESVEKAQEALQQSTPDTAPADEPQKKANPLEERAAQLKQWIDDISNELQIKLSDDDIRNYILKGRMTKEVALVPGIMKGTLQTLRIEDLQSIDLRMASIRDEAKFTAKGLENEEAIIVLAYAWTHADGKPLGESPSAREEKIRKMGSLFVERASAARVNFDALVRFVMQERGLIKK